MWFRVGGSVWLMVNLFMRCKLGYDRKWRRKRRWNNGKKSFLKIIMDRSWV